MRRATSVGLVHANVSVMVPLILIIGLVTFSLTFGLTGLGLVASLAMAGVLAIVGAELARFFRPKLPRPE